MTEPAIREWRASSAAAENAEEILRSRHALMAGKIFLSEEIPRFFQTLRNLYRGCKMPPTHNYTSMVMRTISEAEITPCRNLSRPSSRRVIMPFDAAYSLI